MEKILGENWESYPVLNVGKRNGPTSYIDYIRSEEVTSSVMRGADMFGRPFVVIRACGEKNGKKIPFLQTVFQRYTDSDLWVGGYAGEKQLLTNGGLKPETFAFLHDLCKGKTIERLESQSHYDTKGVCNFVLY